jgi:hypothetical protein
VSAADAKGKLYVRRMDSWYVVQDGVSRRSTVTAGEAGEVEVEDKTGWVRSTGNPSQAGDRDTYLFVI